MRPEYRQPREPGQRWELWTAEAVFEIVPLEEVIGLWPETLRRDGTKQMQEAGRSTIARGIPHES